jgi:hypothetical protein
MEPETLHLAWPCSTTNRADEPEHDHEHREGGEGDDATGDPLLSSHSTRDEGAAFIAPDLFAAGDIVDADAGAHGQGSIAAAVDVDSGKNDCLGTDEGQLLHGTFVQGVLEVLLELDLGQNLFKNLVCSGVELVTSGTGLLREGVFKLEGEVALIDVLRKREDDVALASAGIASGKLGEHLRNSRTSGVLQGGDVDVIRKRQRTWLGDALGGGGGGKRKKGGEGEWEEFHGR